MKQNWGVFGPILILSFALSSLSAILQQPVIRVVSSLVMVPVSVTDSSGKVIENLQAADFRIEENGEPIQIEKMYEPGKTPLDLALLFDVSGSVNPRFQFEAEAATVFLKKIVRPIDSVLIMSIGPEPRVIRPRTDSLPAALDSLRSLEPTRFMTAFYDSVVGAARLLLRNASPETRRAEIVLSDGEDNNSSAQLPDAQMELQRADCIFYSINPGGRSLRLNQISIKGQEGMQSLAAQTGGVAFVPESPAELEPIFGQIATELQAQYLLGYYPSKSPSDGSFRRIVVTVPDRTNLRIRARQGYYSPRG